MTHAYHETYLEQAQESFGCMLDFAVHCMQVPLEEFYSWFLYSDCSRRFGKGDFTLIAGRSGPEIAMDVYYDCHHKYFEDGLRYEYRGMDLSQEYWTGWALSYYQWESNLPFALIEAHVPIGGIIKLYPVYHEMDVRQFVDYMNRNMQISQEDVRLKQFRRLKGYSQRQLAQVSGVPIRTIQQYEQGQKSINKAQAQAVVRLASALGCDVRDLME